MHQIELNNYTFIKVKLVPIDLEFNSISAFYTPFHFLRRLSLRCAKMADRPHFGNPRF